MWVKSLIRLFVKWFCQLAQWTRPFVLGMSVGTDFGELSRAVDPPYLDGQDRGQARRAGLCGLFKSLIFNEPLRSKLRPIREEGIYSDPPHPNRSALFEPELHSA